MPKEPIPEKNPFLSSRLKSWMAPIAKWDMFTNLLITPLRNSKALLKNLLAKLTSLRLKCPKVRTNVSRNCT